MARGDDGLRVVFRHARPLAIRRLSADEFAARGTILLFTRDDAGAVTGMLLSQGRMRNIEFEKSHAP